MQPISAPTNADPATEPGQPPYAIPPQTLLAMVHTLSQPQAQDPASIWQAVVHAALGQLGTLDPRDPIEAMLAVQVVSGNAGALDALRIAMSPDTTAVQAQRQRANAAMLNRGVANALRMLGQRKKLPVAPERDWGDAVEALSAAWQQAPARPAEPPRSGKAAEPEPAEIIRWFDEVPDDELAVETERLRKEAAGEPPSPLKPGPRVVYKHKPGDYALTWKGPDPRNLEKYPGWENMTMPERRAYFGYKYEGPGCPISMLSPESQAAHAAGEE
jgi:hypothetical protein